MNTEMHGRKIKEVYWPDTESEQGRHLESRSGISLCLSATYHGDRDEFWIVETNADGAEIARHNPRFVESILWEV